MIQRNNVNLNNIRKYCADYVQIIKEPTTKSNQVAFSALMIFELIMDEVYGENCRKELMDIVKKKQECENDKT